MALPALQSFLQVNQWKELAYTLRTCCRTRIFLSLFPVWYRSNGTRKMSKFKLIVVGESLNMKLWKVMMLVAVQFSHFHFELCRISLTPCSYWIGKELVCYLESCSVAIAKEEAKQQATCMDGLSNEEKKTPNIIPALYLFTFVRPQPVSCL